jgi:hypothetical protein
VKKSLLALLCSALVAAPLIAGTPATPAATPPSLAIPAPSSPLPNGVRPLSAIAVSQCGMALALFIQLDATHLMRADPKQSDLFVAQPDGTMKQTTAGPLKWEKAYALALSAVLTTHVVIPCTDRPGV